MQIKKDITPRIQLLILCGIMSGCGPNPESIHDLIAEGNTKRLQELLEAHPEVAGYSDESGNTPLHNCNDFDDAEVCREMARLLLSVGADVNARSSDESTPIFWAVESGDIEMVRLLVDSGADCNARGEANWRPIHSAASLGLQEITKLLLDCGADPNQIEGNCGRTALDVARVDFGKEDVDAYSTFLAAQGAMTAEDVYKARQ